MHRLITQSILNFLNESNLSLDNCRGQSYDGAASMAGEHSGVQKRIRDMNPKAAFTHCYAHCLNLAVVASCQNSYVENMLGTVEEIYNFFSSAKRIAILEKHCATGKESQQRLKKFSDTRWSSRVHAFSSFQNLYDPVCDSLLEISDTEHDCTIVSKANSLLSSFLLSLQIAINILKVTKIFSDWLQSPNIDLLQVMHCKK